MKVKHGLVRKLIEGGTAEYDFTYEFYWMGEKISEEDFNDRFRSQTISVAQDVNSFIQGFDAKKILNAGQRTLIELKTLEQVAKLPLCPECRKLIGESTT